MMDPVDSPPPHVPRVFSRHSSVSEFDSPSDSDWLDISSARESDDNDSVSSDSDRERVLDDIPPSRRSSISLGSSRDGDIEAWEGFADDSADESSVVDLIPPNVLQIASLAAHEPTTPAEDDVAEDQRVRDALDQSMISTLSASRSSSLAASGRLSTPNSSPRDLRLSFPDPLTSSRDELNTSYERVSPTESAFSTTDNEVLPEQPVRPPSPTEEDPGTLTTPEVPKVEATRRTTSTCYLDVVLYGSSPSFKWTFIDNLVKKAATGAGDRAIVLSHKITHIYTRTLRVQDGDQDESFSSLVVSVTDRTESNQTWSYASSTKSTDRPSLAVIYLPATSSLPAPTECDYYLPVLAPPSPDTSSLDDEKVASEAMRVWNTLSIPTSKIVQLQDNETFNILDAEALDQIEALHVQHVFDRLAVPDAKKPAKRFTRQLNSVQTVTLFALLSVVLGCTVNIAFRPSGSPTPSVVAPTTDQLWGLSSTMNHSPAVSPKMTNSNEPFIVSSMKDFALAVFNPGTTSLSAYSKERPIPGSEEAKTVADCHRHKTWFEKAKSSSKDIISRPVPPAPALQQDGSSSLPTSPPDVVSSISLRIPDSISPLFDFRTMLEAADVDVDELTAALDNLILAISKQTSAIVEKSLDTAQVLRDGLRYRNARAKGKAKELRGVGEHLVSIAEEHIRMRAGIAKVKAKALKDRYLANARWGASHYSHIHGRDTLERRMGKSGRHGHRKRKLFCGGF